MGGNTSAAGNTATVTRSAVGCRWRCIAPTVVPRRSGPATVNNCANQTQGLSQSLSGHAVRGQDEDRERQQEQEFTNSFNS